MAIDSRLPMSELPEVDFTLTKPEEDTAEFDIQELWGNQPLEPKKDRFETLQNCWYTLFFGTVAACGVILATPKMLESYCQCLEEDLERQLAKNFKEARRCDERYL